MANEKNKIEVVLSLLDKATAPFVAFNKRLEAIQSPVRSINNKLAMMGKEAGLVKLRDAAGGVGTAFGSVAKEVTWVAKKVVLGAGIAGLALFGLTKMASNAGDRFDELSTIAGMSATGFQKAAYAASFSSVEQEALATSLAKMNANMIAAMTGNKEMQVWFKRAGISVAELRKLKPEDVLGRIMDKVKEFPKESAKGGTLLKAIFGKTGAALLPVAEGFRDLTKEAVDLGIVLSDADVKMGAEFNDTFDRMVRVLKGVGMAIGVMLMPLFGDAIKGVTEWVLANRELIKTKVAEWIEKFKAALPEIIKNLRELFDFISSKLETISTLTSMIGGLGNALALLSAIMMGKMIFALFGLTKALLVMSGVIFATPIGWIAAAITAAVVLIAGAAFMIYKHWGPIKDFFANLWDGIVERFSYGVERVKLFMQALNPFSKTTLAQATYGAPKMGDPAGYSNTAAAAVAPGQTTATNNAKVEVSFKDVPRGVTVTPQQNDNDMFQMDMGYAMMGA